MDWEGRKLAEQLMQILLLAFAAAAFITGYLIGSFQMMLLVYLGGGILTALVIVPNWPLFNRHPLNWLQPSEADLHPKPICEAPSTKKKPLKHKWEKLGDIVVLPVSSRYRKLYTCIAETW